MYRFFDTKRNLRRTHRAVIDQMDVNDPSFVKLFGQICICRFNFGIMRHITCYTKRGKSNCGMLFADCFTDCINYFQYKTAAVLDISSVFISSVITYWR